MWKLAKGNDFLPSTPLRTLRQLYRTEQEKNAKIRLLAAIHRKQGKSIGMISGVLERHERTVHDWLWDFQNLGIAGKDRAKKPGRRPTLSSVQRRDFLKQLERGPLHNPGGLWTTKEVRALLQRKYGAHFVPQHIWRIMRAAGFSLQTPRKKHYKRATDEEIRHFKKSPIDWCATIAKRAS